MLSYLKGKVLHKGAGFLILNVNNVGYKIFATKNIQERAKEGEECEVFCFFHLREDAAELYGLPSIEALQLFEALNDIQGIGPRAALALSSLGSIEELKKAIETGNQKFFEGVRGIGTKKLQKIMLELTGKIENIAQKRSMGKKDEAVEALVTLGFSRADAADALSQISTDILDTGQRVKEALKFLGRA
ncbi:MAG: Holliday junction branch migration protein RuvA [Candidatus Wildermuthbacteria bacterium]|nr:Holliday junction branch migration protein RuvA [Candidatus Wildermuthbacteria bacterium]